MERKKKILEPGWSKIKAGWPIEFYDQMNPHIDFQKFHLWIDIEEPIKPSFKRYLKRMEVDTSDRGSILVGYLTRDEVYRLSQRPWVIQLTPARKLRVVAPQP